MIRDSLDEAINQLKDQLHHAVRGRREQVTSGYTTSQDTTQETGNSQRKP